MFVPKWNRWNAGSWRDSLLPANENSSHIGVKHMDIVLVLDSEHIPS
jgi:hypothetical protein